MELIYFLIIISVLSAIGSIWGIIQIRKIDKEENKSSITQ
jgi:hypothetical protein